MELERAWALMRKKSRERQWGESKRVKMLSNLGVLRSETKQSSKWEEADRSLTPSALVMEPE